MGCICKIQKQDGRLFVTHPISIFRFRVVIFLVGCPLIVLLAFFWTVVKTFLNYWRDLRVKSAVAAVYQNGYKQRHPGVHGHHGGGGPPTMYTPEPGHWDHPVPVWAMRPPPSVWDPDYLQQLDPRYALEAQLGPPRPSSRYRNDSKFTLIETFLRIPTS